MDLDCSDWATFEGGGGVEKKWWTNSWIAGLTEKSDMLPWQLFWIPRKYWGLWTSGLLD